MFLLSTSFALYFLGSLVKAQNTNGVAVNISAIEAHFTGAHIVPDLLPTFDPSCVMNVTFPSVGTISPGQNLTQDQVASAPLITVVAVNSTVDLQGNFTLVMADADIVGTNESNGQTRHWLVNGVVLTGSNPPLNVSTDNGVAVTEYAGPAPASGSGPHRYVILLLSQPSNFSPPANLSSANVGVSVFELTDYISTSNLGPIVAGMYFDVEVGTATVTPSPTSPVISSTLKPATSTGTSTSSGANPSKASSSSSNGATATWNGHSFFAVPVAVGVLFASYMCL